MIIAHAQKKVRSRPQQRSREKSNYLVRLSYPQGCIIQRDVITIDYDMNDAPCVCTVNKTIPAETEMG